MYGRDRSVYRPEAVQRYLRAIDRGVLPRLVAPRAIALFWILLGLLLAGGLGAWFTEIPLFASGQAVGVRSALNGSDSVALVAFLPPETLSRLRVGQKVFVNLEGYGVRWSNSIVAVAPEISSPAEARARFGLDKTAALAITRPSAVAIASWSSEPASRDAAMYAGAVYGVDVELGSRRLISLLPLLGRAFGD
jgi:hypothetical protein